MKKRKEKRKSEGTILNTVAIILCVILIPILIVNCTLLIRGWLYPDKVPMFAGMCPMVVQTDSMSPEFDGGDLIIVKEVTPEAVRVGDVISFFDPARNDKIIVTHRVVDVTKNEDGEFNFRTKGDANNIADKESVPSSLLVGRYSSRIKGLGRFVLFLQSVPGIICVLVPIIIICVVLIVYNGKRDKKDKEIAALKEMLEEDY